MRSLHRAVTSIDRGGTALAVPFQSWAERSITIRRGEVSMIAGQPGAGKSTLALAVALQSGAPTLYVSADSHESTMALRTISMSLCMAQAEAENRINLDPTWAAGVLRDHASHIKWMFDPSPTLADLEDAVATYRMMQGDNPHLVVVDNAVDITHDAGDEFASLRNLMREVKWWSRDTGAAFLILHHTSEQYAGNPCPPRAALHGKISQIPSAVITIAAPEPNVMALCAVKNRYGPADPSGSDFFRMYYHPATMTIKDFNS